MFGSDRRAMREMFVAAWRRHRRHEVLSALEAQIVQVVTEHPEYHAALGTDAALERDYDGADGAANPFLHMAMHLALREQRDTDRPPGATAALEAITRAAGNRHHAEHLAMECLGEALWQSQREGRAPDEGAYLAALRERAARATGGRQR